MTNSTTDDYQVNESELADAARLEGITPEIIEVLYSCNAFFDDPAAPPESDPYADFFTWQRQQRRTMRSVTQYELTDLMHVIDRNRPEQRRQALAEWQAHMNDGWETVNISELLDADGKITRIVILRRECPPPTLAPDPIITAASTPAAIWASMDAHLNAPPSYSPSPFMERRPTEVPVGGLGGEVKITIHPTVTTPPLRARPLYFQWVRGGVRGGDTLAKLLADHPIAAHVREHGVEATLEAMNSRARDAARAAYENRLTSHSSRPTTLIPSTL